ncbi:heme ABC transporter permease [Alphaproteobacteria bacterium]|nr:heme ABC transporter permease [Alphaproteobacteria bacterium]
MSLLHYYANPSRFLKITKPVVPWLITLMALLMISGLYLGLFASPPDYQQGETVRIIYFHVPAAIMASVVYSFIAVFSAVGLIWKHPLAFFSAKAVAPIGLTFTFLALATGSLWGKPTWGTWWIWDARLTSVLILFFLYLGYMVIWKSFDNQQKASQISSILALVGAINLPIIKFSVDWWNTLHQGASIFRLDGPTIHPDILIPLLLMLTGYFVFFLIVTIKLIEIEILDKKIRILQIKIADKND